MYRSTEACVIITQDLKYVSWESWVRMRMKAGLKTEANNYIVPKFGKRHECFLSAGGIVTKIDFTLARKT